MNKFNPAKIVTTRKENGDLQIPATDNSFKAIKAFYAQCFSVRDLPMITSIGDTTVSKMRTSEWLTMAKRSSHGFVKTFTLTKTTGYEFLTFLEQYKITTDSGKWFKNCSSLTSNSRGARERNVK